MGLPSPNDTIWANIISGKKAVSFDFLAVRIFLGTAQNKYKIDPSILPQLATELYKLFEKNQSLPSVVKDISKL